MADEIKPIKIPTRITAAQIEMIRAAEKRDKVRLELDKKVAAKLAAELRLRELRALPESPEVPAWCADLTEDLTGEVATIEVPGEGLQNLLVAPGYEGAGGYLPARDGRIASRAGMNPLQLYLAAALLPGWQKFRPTYRFGTITAIDYNADTATVALEDARSSAQSLRINRESSLRDVPVVYMSCNSGAFEIGDEVVIRFVDQDWSKPTVIGFKSRPKGCNAGLYCIPARPIGLLYIPPVGEGVLGETRSFAGNRGNPDFVGAWALKAISGLPTKTWTTVAYGNRTWYGPGGLVLSWHGHPSRVFKSTLSTGSRTHEYTFDSPLDLAASGANLLGGRSFFPGRQVFYRQDVLLDLDDHGIDAQMVVVGAALAGDTLRVMVRSTLLAAPRTHQLHEFALSRSGASLTVTGDHVAGAELTTASVPITDWYFSADGENSVCTMHSAEIEVHRLAGGVFSLLRSEPFAIGAVSQSVGTASADPDPVIGPRSYDTQNHTVSASGTRSAPPAAMLLYADYRGNSVTYAEWQRAAISSDVSLASSHDRLLWNEGESAAIASSYVVPLDTSVHTTVSGSGLSISFDGAPIALPEPAGTTSDESIAYAFSHALVTREGPEGMGSYPYRANYTAWDTARSSAATTVAYAPLVIDARHRIALMWMTKTISTESSSASFSGMASLPNGGFSEGPTGSRTTTTTNRVEQRIVAASTSRADYVGGLHVAESDSTNVSTTWLALPFYYSITESDITPRFGFTSGAVSVPAGHLSQVNAAFAAGSGSELMFSFFTPGNSGGAALYPELNGALLYRRSAASPIDLIEHFGLDRATQALRDVSAGP